MVADRMMCASHIGLAFDLPRHMLWRTTLPAGCALLVHLAARIGWLLEILAGGLDHIHTL